MNRFAEDVKVNCAGRIRRVPVPSVPVEARGAQKTCCAQGRRDSGEEEREESFMPVEITGAWVRAGKGIGGRIVLGVVCAGALRLRSGQAEAPAS